VAIIVVATAAAWAPAAVGLPTLAVDGPGAVPWGAEVGVAGSTDATAPVPATPVRIEVMAFPFDGAWTTAAALTSDVAGAFRGRVVITRNSRIRAVVAGPAGEVASPEVTALALPQPVASAVRREGRSMVRRAEYRLPPSVVGRVSTAWVAYGGSRADRRLRRIAGGTQEVALRAGRYAVTRRVAVPTALPMSGGVCEAPDFAALGFGAPPRACPTGPTAARADLRDRVPEVTIISDSVGTGLDYVAGGRARATGAWSAVFDLKVCRRLVAPPCPHNPPSALSVIRSSPSPGDIVLVHVGYNDSGSGFDIDRVMAALRARGVQRVVFVNLQAIAPFASGVNPVIRRAAGRYRWLQVADWSSHSAGRPWFTPDRDHLTPSGAYALADFYRVEVGKAVEALQGDAQRRQPR
jgi:hypothetical protein